MKRILNTAILAASFALLAACGGQVQAQTNTLGSQIRLSAGASINVSAVRYISVAPGNQYVIDRTGRKLPMPLVSVTQVTSTVAFPEMALIAPDLYANLAETIRVYCDPQQGSIIEWLNGAAEPRADGCAFAYRVESFSRAR